MLPNKKTQNKSGVTQRASDILPKTLPASTSIITYSPSKFVARTSSGDSVGNTYTKKQTFTSAQTHSIQHVTSRATIPKTTTSHTKKIPAKGSPSSYYVVKAGSLGSAATVSGAAASSASKLQLHAAATVTAVSPAAAAAVAAPTTSAADSSSTISVPSEASSGEKMEHSYMREPIRPDISNGLAPARTILVCHAPQCSSCHTHSVKDQDQNETQESHVPPYDEIVAKEMMNECSRIANYVKNNNPDEQDWEARVNQYTWTHAQKSLFSKVTRILDYDQLARLANDKRQHEAIHRRVSVDKSSSRMRRALASVAWEPRLTQWLHMLLMEHLPPSYMASYLDIMQTLKTKLPTLTDKMLFSRPLNNSQELLAPVMKKKWEPPVLSKPRQLTHNTILVALPNLPTGGHVPERMQKWYKALSNMTKIVQITLPNTNDRIGRQNLDQVAETIVCLTRVRINELRSEDPNRGIILIGFNAGSALALQVAMSESVACVVCMGFAYNTLRGARGAPDDRLLDIKAPILFVIGQNSARTSQEEMEGLRERMQSETSLIVVGSADDSLRVPKSKRRIEGVTQAMIDAMVVDEVFEFINKTLNNPPGPRMPTSLMTNNLFKQKQILADGNANKAIVQARKRKVDGTDDANTPAKIKYVPHIGRPRTRPLPNVAAGNIKTVAGKNTLDDSNLSMDSLLDENMDYEDAPPSSSSGLSKAIGPLQKPAIGSTATAINSSPKTTVSLSAGTKIKMIPSSQFVQLKTLPNQNKMINYSINKTQIGGLTAAGAGTSIGSIVKTLPSAGGSQQIFTLKTNSPQYVSTANAAPQSKFTVIKSVTKSSTASTSGTTNSMDLSNIIDMPIVFADNEGNIAEEEQEQEALNNSSGSSNNLGQLIISQKIIKEANPTPAIAKTSGLVTNSAVGSIKGNTIVLNKTLHPLFSTQSSGTLAGNKVVYLNRNTMKPMTNVISARAGTSTLSPYSKFIVTNSKPGAGTSSNHLIDTSSGAQIVNPNMKTTTISLQTLKSGGATSAAGTLRHSAGNTISLGNKTFPQYHVINGASTTTTGVVSGDGKQIRNIIFKSATGLKQLPVHVMNNRPVVTTVNSGGGTMRRVLNLGVPKMVTSNTVAVSGAQQTLEGQPKVIKLHTTTTTTPKSQDKDYE